MRATLTLLALLLTVPSLAGYPAPRTAPDLARELPGTWEVQWGPHLYYEGTFDADGCALWVYYSETRPTEYTPDSSWDYCPQQNLLTLRCGASRWRVRLAPNPGGAGWYGLAMPVPTDACPQPFPVPVEFRRKSEGAGRS